MSEYSLKAKVREQIGKGPSRRLRRALSLPAIVYSRGQETKPVEVCPRELTKILHGPMRRNSLISLEIEGDKKKRLVMVKDRQIHQTRRELVHVDFVEVDPKSAVQVAVPVTLFGKSEAVVLGGKLDHVLQKMRVSCLPGNVPEDIKVDISALGFGSTHAENIPLPEGVKNAEKPRVVVLTIKKPRGAKDEEGAEGAAAEAAKK